MTRLLRTMSVVAILAIAVGCDDDDSPTGPTSEAVQFQALLSPANEVPPVVNSESGGNGSARITLRINRDNSGTVVSTTADFEIGLANFPPGTALTMAHIHSGAQGVNGPIVVDTGLVAGQITLPQGSTTFSRDNINVPPGIAQQILAAPANFYFNVHSVLNGGGMARGQLVQQ